MQTPTPLVDELPTDLWIFGYGSLVWKNSDVPHVESKFCFVKGYKRRAWQGSTDHRGTVDAPGRVFSIYTRADFEVMGIAAEDSAELHPHSDDAWRVSGLALKVTPEHRKQVIESLNVREIDGYEPMWLPLHVDVDGIGDSRVFVPRALTYIASPSNPRFLGFAPHKEIAQHVSLCRGLSGHNTDYILNLSDALHTTGLSDPHITAIANILRTQRNASRASANSVEVHI